MTRREVLEHLFYVWGVSELGRLRQMTRDYLGYQKRQQFVAMLRRGPQQKGT